MDNNQYQWYQPEKSKSVTMNVLSLVMGIIGVITSCFFIGILFDILGVIFGIIGISKNKEKKALSIGGIVTSAIGIIIFVIMVAIGINGDDIASDLDTQIPIETQAETESEIETETETETEVETETETETETLDDAVNGVLDELNKISDKIDKTQGTDKKDKEPEAETQTETQISEEDFKASCQEFNYKQIARNPDSYVGQNFKVTVKIWSVEKGGLFSSYDRAYKAYTDNGNGWYMDNMIYLFDNRDDTADGYLKILEDDIVTVYGTFDGMVDTKNYLNNSKGEEVGLNIKYVDLISE